ncbi:hypothetical protein F0562_010428 [Nyssa sinensis]|uniref:Uncharacterized protein n=1 Tax=Nyssa sinensis TaxID=561372 RepID=A0A5J5A3W8_9ASTE|nr:hypothetical protein F0562_010428 [Nyssa sinensis]
MYEDAVVIENVTDENAESVKETGDHDESTPDQWSTNVVILEELEEVEVGLASVTETEPPIGSVNPVVSLSEELAQVAQEPIENSGLSDDIGLKSEEIEVKTMYLSDENNGVSAVVEDTVIDRSEPVLDESNGVSQAVIDLVLEGVDSIPVENGISPTHTNSVLSKGVEPSLDEYNGVFSAVVDSVLKGIEDPNLPVSYGNIGETSEAVAFVAKENVTNMLQPADVSSVDADNGGEDCNMSELPESTENQPFIAVTPRPLQQTSWMGCCGLFEVLKHSNQGGGFWVSNFLIGDERSNHRQCYGLAFGAPGLLRQANLGPDTPRLALESNSEFAVNQIAGASTGDHPLGNLI